MAQNGSIVESFEHMSDETKMLTQRIIALQTFSRVVVPSDPSCPSKTSRTLGTLRSRIEKRNQTGLESQKADPSSVPN
ncbi:9142_t:CDS:2 [Diversispora eburnea]|uniref:9142_t:CDS:1 n=1 Tax=Diversispora eburnea TaxID=1213867 RepID=A0A9N9CIE5_9GLOM|nr:9142_t:CDS:2 [Diversispora eburnea]